MEKYIIKFMWDRQEVTGEFESRVCAMANAQTICRRFNIRVTVHQAGNLVKEYNGID